MYYKRLIDKYLLEWKEKANHKPLLLRGARQVGKSSAVKHLGETFKYYIEINFEKQKDTKRLFEELSDIHTIAERIGVLFSTPIIENETLIFLDEIQSCPDAIKSLWKWKEDFPNLHVIAAGSLLEFALKELSSFGVGRVTSYYVYPFSFDEFLMANGKENWIEQKQKANHNSPVFEALHNELVQLFRTYLLVGGMPACVAQWVETHNYQLCAEEQEDICNSYYDDFSKYANKIDIKILRNTLQSVVVQTGKKFVYGHVEGGYRTEEIKTALQMLLDAGLIKRISHTAANGIPLGAETNDKFRKYLFLDSGMLLRLMDLELGGSKQMTEQILTSVASDLVNKGSLTELVCGWELVKYSSPKVQPELYYWENLKNGTSAEVDYILVRDMKILPLEVKSGTSGKMKSLRNFMQSKNLTNGLRCSLENFSQLTIEDETNNHTSYIDIVPLYALSNL